MRRITIHEPTTTFTDLLIFVLGIGFAWEIQSLNDQNFMHVRIQFAKAFWLMGAAGFFGALSHGFGLYLSASMKNIFRKLTLLSIGFTSFSLLMGALYHGFPTETVMFIRWFLIVLVLGYILLIMKDDRFINAIKFYLPALLFMMGVMFYSYFYRSSDGTGWILVSILAAFLGAGAQVSGFNLHKHFNHNDMYHVIQMVSMWCLYRGVILLKDY